MRVSMSYYRELPEALRPIITLHSQQAIAPKNLWVLLALTSTEAMVERAASNNRQSQRD